MASPSMADMLVGEMGVAFGRSGIGMAEQAAHRVEVKAAHHGMAGERMAAIVDAHIPSPTRARSFCQRAPRSVIGPSPLLLGKAKSSLRGRPSSTARVGGGSWTVLGSAAILIMATVNHFMLSQLSKLARFEAEMSRNIDFYALLALEMAGITFVAFDQQP